MVRAGSRRGRIERHIASIRPIAFILNLLSGVFDAGDGDNGGSPGPGGIDGHLSGCPFFDGAEA
jgi:hypothetical protein